MRDDPTPRIVHDTEVYSEAIYVVAEAFAPPWTAPDADGVDQAVKRLARAVNRDPMAIADALQSVANVYAHPARVVVSVDPANPSTFTTATIFDQGPDVTTPQADRSEDIRGAVRRARKAATLAKLRTVAELLKYGERKTPEARAVVEDVIRDLGGTTRTTGATTRAVPATDAQPFQHGTGDMAHATTDTPGPPTWENTYNSQHRHWGHLQPYVEAVRHAGYPYHEWNGVVYDTRTGSAVQDPATERSLRASDLPGGPA